MKIFNFCCLCNTNPTTQEATKIYYQHANYINWISLMNEMTKLSSIDLPTKKNKSSEELLIKTVQRKVAEGDISGAVRVLCSQEGIAEYSSDTIEKLKSKHPDDNVVFTEEIVSNIVIQKTEQEHVIIGIRHFPVSSAGGLDGLRPRHLKDLISFSSGDAASNLIIAIGKFVDLIRSGKVDSNVLPIFYGATLTALNKKKKDIRPIAVGLTWRRLAGKIVIFDVYNKATPPGPAAFCIGLKKLTHSLLSRLNSWFLDDGTIGDKLTTILEDIKEVIEFFNESGMLLNSDKCEVYFINASETIENEMFAEINALLPGIKKLDASSFDLLGAPIFEDGITRMLSSKFEEMKIFCNRLKLLDVHPALSIFRSSLSSPKFQYLLRTSPTFENENLLSEIDEFFRITLESITNNKIDELSWKQASLPLSFSGLGLRKLTELAHPSYFSSVYQSLVLSNKLLGKFGLTILDNFFDSKILNYPSNFIPDNEVLKVAQASWDILRTEHIFNELLESSEPIDRARILASSTKTSSKWLQAIPSHQLGLLLDNNAARIAVALRLGCKVCERHKCVCGIMVEENGDHGLSCRKSAGRFWRHCDINKILSMAFTAAGFPNILEPPGLSRIDGKRPDGLTLIPWSNGKGLLWDATVVDTLAPSYIKLSSKSAGSVADKAERHKHNTYINLKENNHLFTPLAFETLGCIGPETSRFLSILSKKLSQATFEPKSLHYLLERLSIAIQRYNAVCVLGTFDKHNNKVDDIYLL